MVSAMLLGACGILSYVAIKSSFWILKFIAGISWWGLAFWWIADPFTTAGTPPHIVMLFVALLAGIAMMMLTFWQTKNDPTGRETGKFHIPFTSSDDEDESSRHVSTHQERVAAYRSRIGGAYNGDRRGR
jgi:hypothetical protein